MYANFTKNEITQASSSYIWLICTTRTNPTKSDRNPPLQCMKDGHNYHLVELIKTPPGRTRAKRSFAMESTRNKNKNKIKIKIESLQKWSEHRCRSFGNRNSCCGRRSLVGKLQYTICCNLTSLLSRNPTTNSFHVILKRTTPRSLMDACLQICLSSERLPGSKLYNGKT